MLGLWGGTIGLSLALGPVVGGLLVASAGWRSVFWINLPIGVAAIVLTTLFVPESKALVARRPDPVGQVLVIAFLVSVVCAIIEGAHAGFGSIPIILLFAAGALAAAVLVRYERRRDQPLIDPRFLRSVPFAGATVIAIAAFVTMSGFLFLNTLYLRDVRGYSALRAGLLTVPMAGAAAIASAVSGRITATRGAREPLVAAGALIVTAAVLLTFVAPDTPLPLLLASYVLFGTGFGLVNTPITNTAVAGMPRAEAGVSAAVATTGRQFGNSLGVAILGSIVAGKAPGEFLTASHIGWWVLAGCGALVAMLGVATTTQWAQASADRVAERFLASPGPVTGAEAEATTA